MLNFYDFIQVMFLYLPQIFIVTLSGFAVATILNKEKNYEGKFKFCRDCISSALLLVCSNMSHRTLYSNQTRAS